MGKSDIEKINPDRDELGRWKKGSSGNMNGRPPKDWTFAGLLRKVGSEVDSKTGHDLKYLAAKRAYVEAINGNIAAFKEITARTDGTYKKAEEDKEHEKEMANLLTADLLADEFHKFIGPDEEFEQGRAGGKVEDAELVGEITSL